MLNGHLPTVSRHVTSFVQYNRTSLPVLFWRVVFRNRTGWRYVTAQLTAYSIQVPKIGLAKPVEAATQLVLLILFWELGFLLCLLSNKIGTFV